MCGPSHNNRLTHSPTTSPYGDSSFPKEENGEYYRLSNYSTTPAFSHPSFPEGGEWRYHRLVKLPPNLKKNFKYLCTQIIFQLKIRLMKIKSVIAGIMLCLAVTSCIQNEALNVLPKSDCIGCRKSTIF